MRSRSIPLKLALFILERICFPLASTEEITVSQLQDSATRNTLHLLLCVAYAYKVESYTVILLKLSNNICSLSTSILYMRKIKSQLIYADISLDKQ